MGGAPRRMLLAIALLIATFLSACGQPSSADVESRIHRFSAAKLIIALTFDDGLAEHTMAGKMLANRGFRGTFFVVPSRLGNDGYLTGGQLDAIARQGHEIGGHTLDHAKLTTLAASDQRRQVCQGRQDLLDRGYDVRSFAYPFSARDDSAMRVVKDCGFSNARIVGSLRTPHTCRECPTSEIVPVANAYEIRTASFGREALGTGDLARLTGFITRAADKADKRLLPYVFHGINDDGKDYSISPILLAGFLDWLKAKSDAGELTVRTMGGVIPRQVQSD